MVKASSRVDKFSKSDIIVSPSILSANFAKLGEQVLFLILNFEMGLSVIILENENLWDLESCCDKLPDS